MFSATLLIVLIFIYHMFDFIVKQGGKSIVKFFKKKTSKLKLSLKEIFKLMHICKYLLTRFKDYIKSFP